MELLRRIRSALRDVTDQKQREITRNRLVRALIAYRRRCMGTEHWLPSGWSARDVESFEERELFHWFPEHGTVWLAFQYFNCRGSKQQVFEELNETSANLLLVFPPSKTGSVNVQSPQEVIL